jgi:phosphohistidine swiveling domain-containing protein
MERWHKVVERRNTAPFFDLISSGFFDENWEKLLGFRACINSFRNYNNEVAYKEREFIDGVQTMESQMKLKKPDFFISVLDTLEKRGRELVVYVRKISANPPEDKESLKAAIKEIKHLAELFSPSLSLISIVDPVIENMLREKLKGKPDEYFQSLMSPDEADETVQEAEELFGIKKMNLSGKELEKKLKDHMVKWGWLFSGRDGRNSDEQIFESIKQRYLKDSDPESAEEKMLKVRGRTEEIVKELNLDKDFIRMVKYFVYFRTHRMNLFIDATYHLNPMLESVSRAISTDSGNMYEMSFDEMISSLDGNTLLESEFEKRKRFRMLISENGKMKVIALEKPEEEKITADQVSGNIAFIGLIRGTAKIIKDTSDLNKVKDGDVLIAPMTIPEFIPAMERASAFVTDEGGITCHAAIVAREMKKPCITGTKIATKIFSDGDLVEVDAEKGIVRKI